MRRALHQDSTDKLITTALKRVGATVKRIGSPEAGCPDKLVGYRGRTFIAEFKSEDGELSVAQVKWHGEWRGAPIHVWRTPLEALQAIGAIRRAA